MSEAMIGALRAVLGIDTVAFSKGLKDAEKSLNSFQGSFLSIAKKLALPVTIAGTFAALAHGIQKAIDAADEMGKASEKFGVPVEQLSRLKYAAEQNEVSFESLGKGLKNFGVITQQALANPAGEAAKKLQGLGITIEDIRSKNTEELFLKAADGTQKLADGFGKVNAVSDAFGKKIGTDLIPLLDKSSAGIRQAGEEADKLGITISTKTALAADKFNDEMLAIGKFAPGVFQQVAAAALPALTAIASQFKNAGIEGGFLKFAVEQVSKFIIEAVFEFNRLAYIIGQVAVAWQNFKTLFSDKRTFEEMVTAQRNIAEAISNIFTKSTEVVATKMLWDEFAHSIEMTSLAVQKLGQSFLPTATTVGAANDSIQKFIESLKKSQEHQRIQIETANSAIGVRERLIILADAEAAALQRKFPLNAQEKADIDALANSAANYAVQLAGIATTKENLTPLEAYRQKLEEINQQLQAGAISAETHARAAAKALVDIQNATLTAASQTMAGFSSLFMELGKKNKRMFEVGKAFAIAEAIINTFRAANQALAAPPGPPFSYVYVAGAIAAGLANVIKIQSQQFTGAALGGSFKVPGGATGVDTKLVRMQLSPGERVDVTPASRAGGGESRELIIPSIRPKDFFTGETVREMVLSIDRWMKDGGTGIRLAT